MFEQLINQFVDDLLYQAESANNISKIAEKAVEILSNIPSMSPCHDRDFKWSRPIFTLKDGTVVKICRNVLGLNHVFLADNHGKLVYGGFVNWLHSDKLQEAISKIRKELT